MWTRHRVMMIPVALAVTAAACGSSDSSNSATAEAVSPENATTSAEPAEAASTPSPGATECPVDGEEWETAKLYIEHNATDEDTGVHGLFGGEAWSELCIVDPTGSEILQVDPLARLNDLTVADVFFESREPPGDEYSVADLMADFPEGDYTVSGTDFEGTARIGSAVFTHDIPVEPNIESPPLAEDVETAGDATIAATGLVISWDPVTETLAGDTPEITGYEVIITQEEFEDLNGLSRPIYDVHVPADLTSLSVPDEFLMPATIYELEVLALEVSGNQTISVGFFATE